MNEYETRMRYHWKWARRYAFASVACGFACGFVVLQPPRWRALIALLASMVFARLAVLHNRLADRVLP